MGSANPGQAVIRLNDKLGLKTGELYFMPASTNVTAMLRTLRTGFEIVSFMKALESLQKLFELDYLFIDTHPGIENDTLRSEERRVGKECSYRKTRTVTM